MSSSPVGALELHVDSAELTAELAFTPDPRGEEWSLGKAMRLVMDARLAGVPQKLVEAFLAKCARSSAPVAEIIVQGVVPESPSLEDPEWEELPVPAEMEAFRDSVLRSAPAPSIFRVRVEKISVERTVQKPGPLPFLHHKTEKVVEVQRREVKEAVALDTRVLRMAFARKGQRLGILSAARPGKPGRSVRGKPLPPLGLEDTTFYCGQGVARNKNELVASEDGFVRIGQRWVDIVPFAFHSWEVALSADKTSCFLNFTPGDVRLPLPTARDILAKAEELGLPRDTLASEDEINKALRLSVAESEPLLSFSISENRDAFVEVTVSPDKMRATLTARKGRGRGRPLELQALGAAVARAKLIGMDVAKVKRDLIDFFKGPETDLEDYLLAEGRVPGRGKDREITWSVAFLPEDQADPLRKAVMAHPALSKTAPSLPAFPIEDAKCVAFVKANQAIAKLTASVPGQPGITVHGQPLPGIPGNDPAVRTFENVSLVRDTFLSQVEGLVFQNEKDGEFFLRVLPYKDAFIETYASPDVSEAFVTIRGEEGLGKPPTLEAVLAEASAAGIVYGIDHELLSKALLDARSGNPVENLVFARRKDPVAAGGVQVNWKVRRASGAAVTIRDGGKADYKNQDRSTLVSENQAIVELIHFGGEGEDGTDVLGKPIKALADPGSAPPPTWDASIREEKTPEGNTILRAARTGELSFEGNRLSVVLNKQVAGDVGPGTGNVKFPGAVQVSGSVRSGYTVFAGGDVSVSGSVEAALVSSEGALRIAEGIKGRRKATLRAHKTLEASFAEQALLLAVEDIKLRGACLLCSVKTNGSLVLGGDKGALIGGVVRARKGVEVQNLGSENGIKTEISFGQDYLLADQIETEEKEIAKLKYLIVNSDTRMKELERSHLSLDEVRQDKTKLMKLLEKRTLRVFDLRERFEEHHDSTVAVRGVVYPGVLLESHSRYFEVKTRKERVAFSFDVKLGRIVEKPLK